MYWALFPPLSGHRGGDAAGYRPLWGSEEPPSGGPPYVDYDMSLHVSKARMVKLKCRSNHGLCLRAIEAYLLSNVRQHIKAYGTEVDVLLGAVRAIRGQLGP